jgi:hypothetical protein
MALKSTTKTTTRTPTNPLLGVLAAPEEWREQLDSLPDKDQLGRIPSIFCEPGRAFPKFLSCGLKGKVAGHKISVLMTMLPSPPLFCMIDHSRTRIAHPDHPDVRS